VSPWDWSWEDPGTGKRTLPRPGSSKSPDPSPNDAGSPDGQPPSGSPPGPETRFRRRRITAATVFVVVVLLLLVTLDSRGGGHHRTTTTRPRAATVARLTPAETHALDKAAEDKAIDSVMAYTPAVVQGGTKGNDVALTFDDGPGPYTTQLVATLNALHVQATFFAIGEEERYFSAGTLAELRSGDVIGDHTETHPMMASLSAHEQHNQLLEQIYRMQLLGAPTPRLFRPPYGSFNATTLRQLHALHLLMILWSTDTADYTRPGAPAIAQRALAGAHPGAIILLHDAGGDRSQTIAALPAIVKGLRRRGLRPVTIPRLLLDDPPPPGQPIPTSLSGG
jgi:peptidoglycan/xylan/chitin deacetylase (PgdA/CDA1 family)